jgi:hypothetical protein
VARSWHFLSLPNCAVEVLVHARRHVFVVRIRDVFSYHLRVQEAVTANAAMPLVAGEDAERFCRLLIDYEIILGRCLDRKVGGLLALENAVDVAGYVTELVNDLNRSKSEREQINGEFGAQKDLAPGGLSGARARGGRFFGSQHLLQNSGIKNCKTTPCKVSFGGNQRQ